jgi:dipeptidyl aminopeptidase/acylaminoacyl peptidase
MAQSGRVSDVFYDQSGALVWLENRPEGSVLRVQTSAATEPYDLNADFSPRGLVGFGGGSFSVGGGVAYFVDGATSRIYRQELPGGKTVPITPAYGGAAAPCPSPDGRWLVYVHSDGEEDVLALVDTAGAYWPKKLVSGDDFYMQPAWHPDGEMLVWVAWDHPNMPWNGTRLVLGTLDFSTGDLPSINSATVLAGNASTAVMQPVFSPDGRSLVYLSDRAGVWQLYVYDLQTKEHRRLTTDRADYGQPAWIQGVRTCAMAPDGRSLVALRFEEGSAGLRRVWVESGEVEEIPVADRYTWLEQPAVHPDGEQVAALASGSGQPNCLIVLGPDGEVREMASSNVGAFTGVSFSTPEAITWAGEGGLPIHGLFYPPVGDQFKAPGGPPLIVYVHSGPTSQATTAFDLGLQFFTTRGYAVLAVNYRGSTGYGREYWEALAGQWGVVDVQDVLSGAQHLISAQRVDPGQLAIMGGSAGGYTALRALIEHPGVFRAAVCRYPVVNLLAQAEEHFKFEAHYQDFLIGKLPEAADICRARSPQFHADRIRDPVAIFHGDADPVVSYTQSEALVEVLREKNIPHEYHVFSGEGHGFRAPETIAAYYEAVVDFLERHVLRR